MVAADWRAGIDLGGTFTDILLIDDATGRFKVGKVLTTPAVYAFQGYGLR
ncbi:MAG TPA: hydantoinase/oxoprolinase N-terminal domain-containing protein [Chloroflexota bacterium]|nr:hydantoinase/oxoprolinase N-terminal domain-containing protein [Chloroflexota bacterium]